MPPLCRDMRVAAKMLIFFAATPIYRHRHDTDMRGVTHAAPALLRDALPLYIMMIFRRLRAKRLAHA